MFADLLETDPGFGQFGTVKMVASHEHDLQFQGLHDLICSSNTEFPSPRLIPSFKRLCVRTFLVILLHSLLYDYVCSVAD